MIRRPGARFNRARVPASGGSSAPTQPSQTNITLWLKAENIVKTGGGTPSNGDACDTWNDASATGFGFTAPVTAPTYVASAQNGRAGLRFTKASSQYLQSAANISSIISASTGTIQVVGKFHAYNTSSDNGDANEALLADGGQYMAMNGRSDGSGTYQSYNFDSGYDRAEMVIGNTNFHLFTWQHSGGVLYASVDGAALVSTPAGGTSGDTGSVANVVTIGKNGVIFSDLTILEVWAYSTAINSTVLASNWAYAQATFGL